VCVVGGEGGGCGGVCMEQDPKTWWVVVGQQSCEIRGLGGRGGARGGGGAWGVGGAGGGVRDGVLWGGMCMGIAPGWKVSVVFFEVWGVCEGAGGECGGGCGRGEGAGGMMGWGVRRVGGGGWVWEVPRSGVGGGVVGGGGGGGWGKEGWPGFGGGEQCLWGRRGGEGVGGLWGMGV